MPQVKCKICNKEFHAKPNWILLGHGKYCSMKCKGEDARKGKYVKCYICKKETYKSQKALNGSKSGNFFCSKSCQTTWRNSMIYIGEKHPNWKDGKFVSYRNILIKSTVPRTCMLCKISDKRILAVHHIDCNHKNNTPENLKWLCHNCHSLVHNYKKEQVKFENILKKEKSVEGRASSNG